MAGLVKVTNSKRNKITKQKSVPNLVWQHFLVKLWPQTGRYQSAGPNENRSLLFILFPKFPRWIKCDFCSYCFYNKLRQNKHLKGLLPTCRKKVMITGSGRTSLNLRMKMADLNSWKQISEKCNLSFLRHLCFYIRKLKTIFLLWELAAYMYIVSIWLAISFIAPGLDKPPPNTPRVYHL